MEIERMRNGHHHRKVGACLLFGRLLIPLVASMGLTGDPARGQQAELARPEPSVTLAKRPVILLTGFEPFGEKREPNPSWEGIKDLDGQSWKGYQLVCKQAKVVWGAPIEQLGAWIAEYRPIAVFSFGAGRGGLFSLETCARNQRIDHKDNAGEKPTSPRIVGDGPKRLEATVDWLELVDALVEKDYPIYISRNAGRYLCEEALYSLEFIKSSRKLDTSVLFCHVPPLGSQITREQRSTPKYVRQFVMDMLESWDRLSQKKEPKVSMNAADETPRPAAARVLRVSLEQAEPLKEAARAVDDPRYANVKKFVEHYFSTWSEQDMDGYDGCFLPEACIQFIDGRGSIATSGKTRFVASQRAFHRSSPNRTIEVPENIDIRFEGKLARAVVYWKLTSANRIERGYDHFTLMTEDGHWRIVNLVFYGTSSGR